jgi:hypothetical protein
MLKLNSGGNPLLDRKEAVERFNTIVEPVFLKKGFRRLNQRSQILINDETKSIVHVTSAPSQVKLPNDFKQKIKKFNKELEGYSSYVLFTRDYSEWKDKPVYLNTLTQVMGISKLSGVVTGLGNLPQMLKSVESNDRFYLVN